MGSQEEKVRWGKGESSARCEGVRHASWHWALNVGHIVFEKDSLVHWCRQSLCYPLRGHSYQSSYMSLISEYSCPLVTAGDWFLDPLVIPKYRDAQVPHILIKRPSTAGPLYSCIPHSQPMVQRASCCIRSLSHVRLCDPMNCSTPAFPVLRCLPGFPGPVVVLKKLFSVLQFL